LSRSTRYTTKLYRGFGLYRGLYRVICVINQATQTVLTGFSTFPTRIFCLLYTPHLMRDRNWANSVFDFNFDFNFDSRLEPLDLVSSLVFASFFPCALSRARAHSLILQNLPACLPPVLILSSFYATASPTLLHFKGDRCVLCHQSLILPHHLAAPPILTRIYNASGVQSVS
jgi:hypothetical protein